MDTSIWTERAIKQAKAGFTDSKSKQDFSLSQDDLSELAEQLLDLVHFAEDEKIIYFQRIDNRDFYGDIGDILLTNRKLLFGIHPVTKVKKSFFSSQKMVHYDSYTRPIGVKIGLEDIVTVDSKVKGFERNRLVITYRANKASSRDSLGLRDPEKSVIVFYYPNRAEEAVNAKIELEKAIDQFLYEHEKPKAIEVQHKGTIVNVNVSSKGFLLNVEPCPTCGANLFLSQDRKTAYCKYCNKEIPTVEQVRD